jgi:general stress protein YciG
MKDDKPSVVEAGHRGGCKTLERHGREHFRAIGKKGGERTRELYGDLLREFGRRGGRPQRPDLDEVMGEEIPKKGG